MYGYDANLSSTNGLLDNEEQIPGSMPRYAEHAIGAAALIGAFGLVFGAMALGANIALELSAA